jgi:polysaccharide chain length determinant protein (PEP-CTERM system associated)
VIPGKQYTPEILLDVAWRRKWLIILPAMAVATAVIVITAYLPNLYRSDTLILVVPQRVPEAYVRSAITTRIEERLQSISQQILSRTRLERIIQEFNLYADRRKTEIMEDIVERMRKDIDIEVVKGDAFRVGFTAQDPRTAMRVTERLASFFIDENLRDRELLAESTNQFLESQLEDARRRLVENERQLEEYRRKHDGELPTQVDSNMQGLHNVEMQLQSLTDSMNRDRDRRLVLERTIADANVVDPVEAATSAAGAPAAEGLPSGTAADQLRAAQALLNAMLMKLTPEHPDVIRLKRTITELQKRAEVEAVERPVSAPRPLTPAEMSRRNRMKEMNAEVENIDRQMASKLNEEKRLRGIQAEYQKRLEAAPGREAELTELMRDYQTLQETYRSLLGKKQDSQIAANLERRQIGEQFKILDPARLPERPYSPDRPRLYALGIISALAIGLLCAAAAEYFDRSMRSEEDVRMALNLPVLATVPMMRPFSLRWRRRRIVAISVTAVVMALASVAAVAWKLLR